MSYEVNGFKLGTQSSSTDQSAASAQYRFQKCSGTGTVAAQSVQGAPSMGVLQNKPAIGESAELCVTGVTKVVAGGVITPGTESRIMSDNQGRAVTAATTGSTVEGTALEAATAAGQLVAVLLQRSVF